MIGVPKLTQAFRSYARNTFTLLIFFTLSRAAFGGSSNHGGDEVRLLFEDARSIASTMATDFAGAPADVQVKPTVAIWIEENAEALAADIQATSHLWPDQNDNVTCARTGNTASPIVFSFVVCRDIDEFTSKTRAARLLVHESVHHFGVTDESFADQIAVVLAAAYARRTTAALRIFTGESFVSPAYVDLLYGSLSIVKMDDKIYTSGLEGFSIADHAFIIDPATKAYRSTAPFPTDGRLGNQYWTGKEVISTYDQTVFRYDPELDHWSQKTDPSAPRMINGSTVVAAPDALYVLGGSHPSLTAPFFAKQVFRYDLATETWTLLASSPGRVVGMSAFWTGATGDIATTNSILAYNTTTGSGLLYNPGTNTWRSLAQTGAPSARTDATANLVGNHLVVWGGRDASGVVGDGAIYSLSDNTWRPMAKGPTARRLHAATAADSQHLVVWGGTVGEATGTGMIPIANGFVYDLEGNTWEQIVVDGYSPVGRVASAAIWTKGSLWLFGGFGVDRTAEVLTPK